MTHPLLFQLFNEAPMVVVMAAVSVTSLVLWKRAPLSSLLILVACIYTLALLLIFPFIHDIVIHRFGTDSQSQAMAYFTFSMIWSTARAFYLILLIVAVYVGREKPKSPSAA